MEVQSQRITRKSTMARRQPEDMTTPRNAKPGYKAVRTGKVGRPRLVPDDHQDPSDRLVPDGYQDPSEVNDIGMELNGESSGEEMPISRYYSEESFDADPPKQESAANSSKFFERRHQELAREAALVGNLVKRTRQREELERIQHEREEAERSTQRAQVEEREAKQRKEKALREVQAIEEQARRLREKEAQEQEARDKETEKAKAEQSTGGVLGYLVSAFTPSRRILETPEQNAKRQSNTTQPDSATSQARSSPSSAKPRSDLLSNSLVSLAEVGLNEQIRQFHSERAQLLQSVDDRNAQLETRSAQIKLLEDTLKEKERAMAEREGQHLDNVRDLETRQVIFQQDEEKLAERLTQCVERTRDLEARETQLRDAILVNSQKSLELQGKETVLERQQRDFKERIATHELAQAAFKEKESLLEARLTQCASMEKDIQEHDKNLSATLSSHKDVFTSLQREFTVLLEKLNGIADRQNGRAAEHDDALKELTIVYNGLKDNVNALIPSALVTGQNLESSLAELHAKIDTINSGRQQGTLNIGAMQEGNSNMRETEVQRHTEMSTGEKEAEVLLNDIEEADSRAQNTQSFLPQVALQPAISSLPQEETFQSAPSNIAETFQSARTNIANADAGGFGTKEEIINDLRQEMGRMSNFKCFNDLINIPIPVIFPPAYLAADFMLNAEFTAKTLLSKIGDFYPWARGFDYTKHELRVNFRDLKIFRQISNHHSSRGHENMVLNWLLNKYEHYGYVWKPLGWQANAMKVVEDEEMLQYLKEVGEFVNDKTALFAMQTFARYLHGDFTSNVRKDVDKQLFPMESRAKFQEFHKT